MKYKIAGLHHFLMKIDFRIEGWEYCYRSNIYILRGIMSLLLTR